jgi:hypothetical protein
MPAFTQILRNLAGTTILVIAGAFATSAIAQTTIVSSETLSEDQQKLLDFASTQRMAPVLSMLNDWGLGDMSLALLLALDLEPDFNSPDDMYVKIELGITALRRDLALSHSELLNDEERKALIKGQVDFLKFFSTDLRACTQIAKADANIYLTDLFDDFQTDTFIQFADAFTAHEFAAVEMLLRARQRADDLEETDARPLTAENTEVLYTLLGLDKTGQPVVYGGTVEAERRAICSAYQGDLTYAMTASGEAGENLRAAVAEAVLGNLTAENVQE